jgi:hypothetical protein
MNRKERRATKAKGLASDFDIFVSPSVAAAFGLPESHGDRLVSDANKILFDMILEVWRGLERALMDNPSAVGISRVRSLFLDDELTVLVDLKNRRFELFAAERPEVSPDHPDAQVVFDQQHSTAEEWAAKRAQFRAARH